MNLPVLPESTRGQEPDGPAVADDSTDLNNTQFLRAVRRAGASLRRHGVSAGDVVAIMLPNTANFVVSLFAAWRLGAAVTPINPSLRPAEATYQIADADAKVLIVDNRPSSTRRGSRCSRPSNSTATRRQPLEPPHHGDDALALLIYTSGTTGRPKGVMLDHANLIAMCRVVIDAFKMTDADHSLLILPLFHVNGIVVGTFSPLLAGGGRPSPAGSARRRSSTGSSRAARRTSPRCRPFTRCCAGCLPSVKPDTSSVRFAICGAAPASVELLEEFESRYGIPIIEGYGLSEGSCASTVNPLRASARRAPWGCRCRGRRFGSSTRTATCPRVRPARS